MLAPLRVSKRVGVVPGFTPRRPSQKPVSLTSEQAPSCMRTQGTE